MLSKKVLLFGFLCCAMIAINARYVSDDMEVAASGKHEEWKKGEGKDHYEDEHSSHGDKGTISLHRSPSTALCLPSP
jgi:hypothetical protein